MREIKAQTITEEIKKLCLCLGVTLDKRTCEALAQANKNEKGNAHFALNIMLENARIAERTATPVCQDTGMAVVFVEIGQEAFVSGNLTDAINEGVRQAFKEGYFRNSVLDPLTRVNTKDNTPAVVHYDIVEGDKLTLKVMLKGFGSENMSRVYMLTPSEGVDGIKRAAVETVREASGNPCPPIVLGVGIGGTMEKAAILSKRALFREVGSKNSDANLNALENEILSDLNALNIGPQGFGGLLTAIAVFIEKFPTHIAGLPVAFTVQCHAVRHGEVIL